MNDPLRMPGSDAKRRLIAGVCVVAVFGVLAAYTIIRDVSSRPEIKTDNVIFSPVTLASQNRGSTAENRQNGADSGIIHAKGTFMFQTGTSTPQNPEVVEDGYEFTYDSSSNSQKTLSEDLAFGSSDGDRFIVPKSVSEHISRMVRRYSADQDGSEGEDLSSWFMPRLPGDRNKILLTTNESVGTEFGASTSTNRIYAYDMRANAITLLYTVPQMTNPRGAPELVPLGVHATTVILGTHLIGYSGVCESTWTDFAPYYAFDPARPQLGLQPYSVPDPVTRAGKKGEEECLAGYQ